MVIGSDLSLELWRTFVDDSANNRGCGARLVVISPIRTCIEVAVRFGFKTLNNDAKYETLLAWLKAAQEQGVTRLCSQSDLILVVNQDKGDYKVKGTRLAEYKTLVKNMFMSFVEWEIRQTPRSENKNADVLA